MVLFLEKILYLLQQEKKVIAILPNADAGSEQILSVYDRLKKFTNLVTVTSVAPLDYLTLLKYADALIGNSSSGIIEAASFKTPVINIGSRQSGRERSVNIVDIGENEEELIQALQKFIRVHLLSRCRLCKMSMNTRIHLLQLQKFCENCRLHKGGFKRQLLTEKEGTEPHEITIVWSRWTCQGRIGCG